MTNSGRASTLAATDAAAPTLRRIERAAIAAATPITYHSRYLTFTDRQVFYCGRQPICLFCDLFQLLQGTITPYT